MKDQWTAENIPDQTGRVAVVTGANSGIGYETALALAQSGAHVVMACRSEERGSGALQKIEATRPTGSAELMRLDLADLDSVRAFAEAFSEKHEALDLLVNNAGVMMPPERRTDAGFELQFGVNVAGHFALTGLLFGRLEAAAPGARVVTLSSGAHRFGQIDFGNLRGEKPYRPLREYGQSKLGDLVFALELQRRLLDAGRTGVVSLAAHPGSTNTDLQRHTGSFFGALFALVVRLWSQKPPQGALPTLFAATAPEAEPGGYYGPDGLFEATGYPAEAAVKPAARDRETARRLWQVCEEATDVRFLSDEKAAA